MEERRPPRSRIRGAGAGVALAAATWLALDQLGIPAVIGVGTLANLPWIALGGVALGALGLLGPLRLVLGLAVVAILLVSFFPLFDNRFARQVRSDPVSGPVDALVVLSGSLTSDERLGAIALERLVSAAAVRPALGTRHLVLTTIRIARGGDTLRSEPEQRRLVARLDPQATLHFVGPVGSTRDEAVAVGRLARHNGWRRVAVMTSPMHTRRACGAFETAGITVLCLTTHPADYRINLRRSPAERMGTFRDWLYEMIGSKVYRSRGWLK